MHNTALQHIHCTLPLRVWSDNRRGPEEEPQTQADLGSGRSDRHRVQMMRSSPHVVYLRDSTNDRDVDFDEEWPEIDLDPADFVVPPPAPETAEEWTCTPPVPKPELSVPPISIQQLARRTATVMAGRPHLRIDQLQEQTVPDIGDTTPIGPTENRTISAAVEMGAQMVSLMSWDLQVS